MIKKFEQYNESVRDQMKPKSKEELKTLVDKETSLLQKKELINKLNITDMFTKDELDKINSCKYEIDIEKQFGKYDVSYSFVLGVYYTMDPGIKEITGTLEPYKTGRSTDYEFEPNWFTDSETETYYSEHWEEIQDRILDKLNKR